MVLLYEQAVLMDKKTEKIILWVFILFAVFSTISIDVKLTRYKLFAMEFSAILIFALWLVRIAYSGAFSVKKNSLNLPVLVYFLLVAFFYTISTDRAVAKAMFESTLFCFLIYFGTANTVDNEDTRKTILKVWLIASIFVGLHGLGSYIAVRNPANVITGSFSTLAGFFDGIGKSLNLPVRNVLGFAHFAPNSRPFATFGNPNFFAAYLIAVLPVFASLLFIFKKKLLVLVNLAVILLLLFNLWCTATRGAWVGFLGSVLLFIILLKPKWNMLIKSKKGVLIILLALAIFMGVIVRGNFVKEFVNVVKRPTDRILIWRDTLVMGLKRPLGVGIGAYHIYFPRYASRELTKRIPQNRFIVNYTHNEYLQVLSETGIPGLFVFLWIIFAFLKTGIKQLALTSDKKNHIHYLTIGLLSGGTGILIQNFFSVSMRFIVASIYLYFIMGMMASCGKGSTRIFKSKDENSAKTMKVALIIMMALFLWFSIARIIQPFIAHKKLTEEVGFFDEKVVSPREAIKKLTEGLKEDPGNANLHYRLAWVYAKEKNWGPAVKHFEATAEINPELEGPYNNLGNIYYLTGNNEKAIENYKKAIAINPGKIDAHFNLGYSYYSAGMLKEASDEFNRILELDPKNYKATIMLEKMVQ